MNRVPLEALAADLEAAGKEAKRQGETDWALRCFEWALILREWLAAAEGLPPVPIPRKMGRMLGPQDSRAIKIGKAKSGPRRHPAVQALYDAGLTPHAAAALLGTSRDVLKQAWAKGDQFREIRPEWRAKLAARKPPVPADVWPTRG